MGQARRLRELEQRNAKLKLLVWELSLEKVGLKEIASGAFKALNDDGVRKIMRRSGACVSGGILTHSQAAKKVPETLSTLQHPRGL